MREQRMTVAAWVGIGAVLGPILGIGYAWVHSGPDHYEWSDAALVMGFAGLCVGAFVGLVVGVFRDETDAS